MTHARTFHTLIGCTILLTTALTTTAAQNPEAAISDKDRVRHETTGVISGAIIGGLLGGPIGAVVTAAFGSWVGDQALNGKENTLLSKALEEKDRELSAMQADYRALEARYQLATREIENSRSRNASFVTPERQTVRQAACCSDTELSLHFRTNATGIEAFYDQELAAFARMVSTLPDAVISITGHADRRGDSSANLALSQRRVESVKGKLKTLGVDSAFIQSSAFGESMPLSDTDSLENNFFDRRVVVKVISAGNGYLSTAND